MSYKCMRDNIINYNITDHNVLCSEYAVLGSVIRDILDMKYHCIYSNNQSCWNIYMHMLIFEVGL